MVCNLDPNFAPFPQKAELSFKAFTFSGGEPHIKIQSDLKEVSDVTLTHRICSFSDMGMLLIAVDALRRMGIKEISAFIPYFPAARQDRVMVPGEPLTVKVYADLINHLELKEVGVYDPHSEVTPALLHNCRVYSNHVFIQEVCKQLSSHLNLISPDGGALKKVYKLAAFLQDYGVIECSKLRDVKTGKLSGFQVYSEDLKGADCLIVDDICDGGGTFLGLAEELKRKGAGKLYLAVSHGIFSKGLEALQEVFTKIFTTDAFSTLPDSPRFQQIKLGEIIGEKHEA